MKMMEAYEKARKIAGEKGEAVVVMVTDSLRPLRERFDAIPAEQYFRDTDCGEFYRYFDHVSA